MHLILLSAIAVEKCLMRMRSHRVWRRNAFPGTNSLDIVIAIFRQNYLILATFLHFKFLMFLVFMCITIITFPSALASSSASPSFGSASLLNTESDDDMELVVTLRHLHSYHQPFPSFNRPSLRSLSKEDLEDDDDAQMDAPDHRSMLEDDDLIYSGSGCFDDEDKCTGFTELGSDDDLITPVYVPSKGSTTISRPYSSPVPEEEDEDEEEDGEEGEDEKDLECADDDDDENCIEGSGAGDALPSSTVKSATENVFVNPSSSPSSYHNPSYLPLLTTPPPPPPPPFTYRSWPQTTEPPFNPLIPSDDPTIFEDLRTPPPWPERPRPTAPRSTSPKPLPTRPSDPKINLVPLPPDKKSTNKEKQRPVTVVPKNSADTMAMIIGIIAIVLIMVVVGTTSFLFLKVKYPSSYKTDNLGGKGIRFLSATGTPPLLSSASHQTQLNTALIESNEKGLKVSKKKDLKEWYV